MKKYIITALLAVALFGFNGCTTTPTGHQALDPQKVAQLVPALQTTMAGTVVYAYSKDKNSVKYIDVVKTALQEFILSSDLSPSALQAKIYGLPIKELKTPEAQLIITPMLAAYKAFGEQYVKATLTEQAGWKLLVQALVDGVNAGLDGVRQIQSP
jgi:hypothetical protein